jgi:hypothetical protein
MIIFYFIDSQASFHCFIFLISVTNAIIFSILDNILKYSGKSEKHSLSLHLVEMNADPYLGRQVLDAESRYGSSKMKPTGFGSRSTILAKHTLF